MNSRHTWVVAHQRRIIVYIATSVDGYIARPDGSVKWLESRPAEDYGLKPFIETVDTVLWGRKTWEPYSFFAASFGAGIRNYVFTRRPPASHVPDAEFVNEPVNEFAGRLRSESGKDIWMMGGAELIASFLDAGEIDEFIIHVVPVLIGEGIPLVAPRHRDIPLTLLSSHPYPDGVIRLHYGVDRAHSISSSPDR